jgi:type IV pilus assembly protein PilP
MRGMRASIVLAGLAALVAVGCSDPETGPKTADYEQQRAEIIARRAQMRAGGATQASAPSVEEPAALADGGLGSGGGDYAYDPLGKRDPFRSFVLDRLKELAAATKGPLEQFDLNQLNVLGVVWETNQRRALVADPSGQAYIVREGDPIGTNDGRVIRIDDNLMLVRETYVDHMGEQTMKEVEMHVRRNLEG